MPENESFEIRQAQPEAKAILLVIVGWLLCLLLQRASLIDHIPIWATLTGSTMGAGFAAYLSYRVFTKGGSALTGRSLATLALLPIFGIFLGTYIARTVWEGVAFTGVDTQTVALPAKVTSIDTKWRDKATVIVGAESREIQVRVSNELFARLEPWRAPGRDCLILPIETGRFGARRVILPNYLEESWGLEHYASCNS